MKLNRMFATALGLSLWGGLWAVDFQYGDLYYTILDAGAKTVEVSKPASGKYTMTEITVPSIVEHDGTTYSVVAIGQNGLADAEQATTITLQEGIQEIKYQGIYSCGAVTTVNLPSTLKVIGNRAFYANVVMTKADLPAGLEQLGEYAFGNCYVLKEAIVPEGCLTLGRGAFDSCRGLETLDIRAKVTEIPQSFHNSYNSNKISGAKVIKLPSTLKTIGGDAFRYTRISTIELPEGLERIESSAFKGCLNLTEITLPENLKYIGNSCFSECKAIKEITIPGSVAFEEGQYTNVFEKCTSLNKVVFEEGVAFIPAMKDSPLKEVHIPASATSIATGAFGSMSGDFYFASTTPVAYEYDRWSTPGYKGQIFVPAGSLEAWQKDSFWGQFANLMELRTKDESKYLSNVGDGMNIIGVTFTWGDKVALDNLASGVYAKNGDKVSDVITTLLTNDKRYYSIYSSKGGGKVGFGFDTNGDNSAKVVVGDKEYSDALGSHRYLGAWNIFDTIDDIDYTQVKSASEYDHWAVNNSEASWKILVNGEEADYDTEVTSGDKINFVYGTAEIGEEFLLRPADQQGVWMAPEIVLNTENGKSVEFPMIANVLDDAQYFYSSGICTEVLDPETKKTIYDYSGYVANAKNGNMLNKITVSTPSEVILRPYLYFKKNNQYIKVYPEDGYYTKVSTVIAHPITGIALQGIEEGSTIELDNMGVQIITPVYYPENADFTGFTVSFEDESIASIYMNVKSLVAHSEGTTKMTVSSIDGTVNATYYIKVKGVDPENRPEGDFSEGMIWLNEEWFTHTSGSLNFIDDAGNIYYRAYGNQNNNMAFGATSCSATVWADKLIVMSKQAWDGGDTRPVRSGGRVVVADAKTLKHIGAIDEIGGDGRSVVGVSPSKAYIGTTAGVRVLNLDDLTVAESDIEGTSADRFGQIGDMVKSGKYVFYTNCSIGLGVIDTTNDKYVKTFESKDIQGVVVSADGRVWLANKNSLTEINPETLEEVKTYSIPGSITCTPGQWRPVTIKSAVSKNTLIWGNGTFYRWDLDEVADPSTLTPVYTHSTKMIEGYKMVKAYGSCGYDDLTETYMYAITPGFGSAALDNWYVFVDAKTGDTKKIVKLPSYWWFPAMPVRTDRYDVEFELDTDIAFNPADEGKTIELNVTDRDNHDCNINLWISEEDMTRAGDAVEVVLNGKTLTVTPKHEGNHTFTVNAESNGRVISKQVNVLVDNSVGVDANFAVSHVVYTVYTVGGVRVAETDSINDIEGLNLAAGVYVVRGSNGKSQKIVIK
ncbi:MAG: leucine-rich repeat protein [Clostridium sp.]|nr:leucine-rich repeat protein [Prevotella sp.]MCM1428877.1 leucine-rich repeat protein [Clostridium sp.]